MEPNQPTPLLGGLSPALFMRRHWQKTPLLVRQAVPGLQPVLGQDALFALAGQAPVESRLVQQQADKSWHLQHGPFARRKIPKTSTPGWTLLVQGVNLHNAEGEALLQQFRFLPDARLDDLMVSFASQGGGVGPHFDSYDVFLLQASGRREWRIGAQADLQLVDGAPLKILQNFQPEESFVLEAGDMLYLPPRYAHEGIALASEDANGCMTYSIGFQAPGQKQLAAQLLLKLAEFQEDEDECSEGEKAMYQDPEQSATENPALIPQSLTDFAQRALSQVLNDAEALAVALGESLSEPKSAALFDSPAKPWQSKAIFASPNTGIRLDSRTRMLYDTQHVFINGESWLAKGADAAFLRELADQRWLAPAALRKASKKALSLLQSWHGQGWLHLEGTL